eukprot:1258209-Amphidinium_carterae.1
MEVGMVAQHQLRTVRVVHCVTLLKPTIAWARSSRYSKASDVHVAQVTAAALLGEIVKATSRQLNPAWTCGRQAQQG